MIKSVSNILVEIYHLERIASILNSPQAYGIRREFLDIEMTKEENLSFIANQSNNNLNDSYPQYNNIERKSINYSLIDAAISKVICDTKLIDFLMNHDFNQPYFRPVLNDLYDLIDVIREHSDEGSPYDSLLDAIYRFKVYLATNTFWFNSNGYFLLGTNRNPEEPHNLAIIVAQELKII